MEELMFFTTEFSAHTSRDMHFSGVHTNSKLKLGGEQIGMNSH